MKNPLFLWICLLLAVPCRARIITVNWDGSGDYLTIQGAINDSNDGDTIIVADGIYTGGGNRDINFFGKAIKVRSKNGPANCVIDCQGSMSDKHRGFYFHSGEDANSILDGFTITNGYVEIGGGICVRNRSTPIIRNCSIIGNSAGYRGGGIYCNSSNPLISNCTITDNSTSSFGGGISGQEEASPIITNCTITGNSAGWYGGGLYECKGDISSCTIRGNWAGTGGGLYCCNGRIIRCIISGNLAGEGGGLTGCYGRIVNCIISGNSANSGGALFGCGGSVSNCTITGNWGGDDSGVISYCNGTVTNCIIWANRSSDSILYNSTVPLYSCVQDGSDGTGSISSDPCFILPGYWDPNGTANDANDDFWVEGDYHLLSESRCIDAGNYFYCMSLPCSDYEGRTRLVGEQIDMGCYEADSFPDDDGDWLGDDFEPGYSDDADRDDDGIVDGLELLRGTDPNIFDPLRQWNVPTDANTIQQALFFSRSGETIVLSEGTHYENIYIGGRNITLTSVDPNDTNVVASTIINADTDHNAVTANGRAITFAGTEDESCHICGLTITGGNEAGSGGGIYGGRRSHAVITSCNITGNKADRDGGGLYLCNGTISNCIIKSNSAFSGGGLGSCKGPITNCTISGNSAMVGGGLSECLGSVTNCTITRNWANMFGGGIMYSNESSPILTNCTITGNAAKYEGGGILCWSSSPKISNCTIAGNRAQNYGGGITGSLHSSPTITNCMLWDNAALLGPQVALIFSSTLSISYSDVQGGQIEAQVNSDCTLQWGTGNIDADPCFVQLGYWDANGTPDDANDDFWIEGDYHLKSQAGRWDPNDQSWGTDTNTSPCIDTGNPNSDWTAELWPHGKRINMGAYGGTPQASMSLSDEGNIADLNNDDSVNYGDLILLADDWLYQQVLLSEDLDRDGAIDFRDFVIFANNWLWKE